MTSMSFKITVPELLSEVVDVSQASANYKRNGDISSFEVDMSLDDLALHKTCKSSDLGILQNKIEKTLEQWETKYQKYLKQEQLADTEANANDLNKKLEATKTALDNILKHTLGIDDAINWDSLKSKKDFKINPDELLDDKKSKDYIEFSKSGEPTSFSNKDKKNESDYEKYFKESGWFSRMFRTGKIKESFDALVEDWNKDCQKIDEENDKRSELFKNCVTKYAELKSKFLADKKEKNDAVDKAKALYDSGDERAIEELCDMVFSNSNYPEVLSLSWNVNYNSETQNLVIDYELPAPESLPMIDSYKFVKSKNEIEKKPLTAAKKKELYNSVLYQICIRSIHEVLEADVIDKIVAVAFNGVVTSLNEGTGNMDKKVIMSVLTTKEEFLKINLGAVVAEKTFQHLNGVAGKSLIDQTAVTPVAVIEKLKKAS